MITIFDQALLEIEMIEAVFRAQFSRYDPSNKMPYPTILGIDGYSGIDGRYITTMELYSNMELFNIQLLKNKIIELYKTPQLVNFVNLSLAEIRNRAILTVNYFNENLTDKNLIVQKYLERCKDLSIDERMNFKETHQAIVTILDDCHIGEIYLGLNMSTKIHRHNYRYNYVFTTNYKLADYCQKVIDYIEKFGLTSNFSNKPPVKPAEFNLEHRQHAIIYKYMADAGYVATDIKMADIGRQFGPKRRQAFYTIWNKKGKTYKEPSIIELEIILPHLSDYPNAQKAAVNDLNKLRTQI